MRSGDREPDPVTHFLASAVVWASEANEPRADRLALIASDLIVKSRATEHDGLVAWARSMGFVGPVGGSERPNSIASDVLARAQASLDSDHPDPAAVAAGVQAARRLIAASAGPDRSRLRHFIARLQLGIGDGLAPEHLVGHVESDDDETADEAEADR